MTSLHRGIYLIAILVAILSAEGVSGLTIDDEALANKTTTKSPSTTTNETAPTTTGTTASPPTTVADSTELETTVKLMTETEVMTTQFNTDVLTTTGMMETTEEPFKYGNWSVKVDNKECMRMNLGGSLTLADQEIIIQPTASSVGSKCAANIAVFSLTQPWLSGSLDIKMQFDKVDQTYKLTRVNFTLVQGTILMAGDRTFDFFEAPVGDYYVCDEDEKIELAGLTLTFRFKKLQPFVQETKGKDYGDEYNCGDPLPPTNSPHKRVGLIVSMTLIAVLIIAVGCFLLFRKRSTYKRFNNGI